MPGVIHMSDSTSNTTAYADVPTEESDLHWRQVAQRHYDPCETTELTTAIVFAIADAKDIDPTTLQSPRLYDCIDATALEDTFFGAGTPTERSTGTVQFRYDTYLIRVDADGWIRVFEPGT